MSNLFTLKNSQRLFNIFKLFGTQSQRLCAIALVAIIGFSFAACDNGTTGGATPTVTSVTIDPATVTVAPGGTRQFTATVEGTNSPAQTVTWTITTSGKHDDTQIDSNGKLTVASGETQSTLTVRATSTVDTGKYAEAAVVTVVVQSDFYGKYIRTQGQYQPYTITITSDTLKFEDKDGDYVQLADIAWEAAVNTATDVPNGSELTNPSEQYPLGYTITGTRTDLYYPNNILSGIFIALSADKTTLYIGKSANNYNRAGFNSTDDSLFTRVQE